MSGASNVLVKKLSIVRFKLKKLFLKNKNNPSTFQNSDDGLMSKIVNPFYFRVASPLKILAILERCLIINMIETKKTND